MVRILWSVFSRLVRSGAENSGGGGTFEETEASASVSRRAELLGQVGVKPNSEEKDSEGNWKYPITGPGP